jgi:hypothetical protein
MTFCLVYEEVQKSLIDKNEVDVVKNQILGMQLSLFEVFGLLKTERGLAQKMTE